MFQNYRQKLRERKKLNRTKIGNISYSQEGEDMILSSLLYRINGGKNVRDGFYVDVGAHHPFRFSNTHLFYEKGWTGINIDPMPGSMALFRKHRPRDINLEVAVDLNRSNQKYYMFSEPALNTFDSVTKESLSRNGKIAKKVLNIPTVPLSEILSKYLPKNQMIDFLSVDVEGRDYSVLCSNDWDKYLPKIVLVEIHGKSIIDVCNTKCGELLKSKGYTPWAKTMNTTLFLHDSSA